MTLRNYALFLLSVKKVLWLCKKMPLFLFEMRSYVFRSVMTWYLGLL